MLEPIVLIACSNPQPPWPNAKIYNDSSQKIFIHTGDEFIIRFTMSYNPYPIIKEIYDDNMITLLDRKVTAAEEQNKSPVYSWFLFKALGTGTKKITIQHLFHITEDLNNQEIFTVVIQD